MPLKKLLRRRPPQRSKVKVTLQQMALFALLASTSAALILLLSLIFLLPQRILEEPWVPPPVRDTIIASREVASELTIIGGFVADDDYTLPAPELSYRTGFKVDLDGFNFRNYGRHYPEGNLTGAQLHDYFGDQICATDSGPDCALTPAAQVWIDTMNDYMHEGHCAGFTIAAYRFHEAQLAPAEFSPGSGWTFDLNQNVPTMQQIAREWVYQVFPEVWPYTVEGTPREIVDSLLEHRAIADLGVFSRSGGGHSMLSFGVEAQPEEGIYHILVYDNNWPNEELFVEVDYIANTWRYSLAATNPNEDSGAWDGDAKTKSLIYVPFEAYEQEQILCPFCLAEQEDDPQGELAYVSLSGDEGLLEVTNQDGETMGMDENLEFIDENEDGELIRIKDNMFNDRAPYIGVPLEDNVEILVQPRPDKLSASANLRMVGPGIAMAVEGLHIKAGESYGISASPANQSIATQAGTVASQPTIQLGIQAPNGNVTLAVLSGASLGQGEGVSLQIDPVTGELLVSGDNLKQDGVNLVVATVTPAGTNIFASTNLSVEPGQTVALDVAGWDGESPMSVAVGGVGNRVFTPIAPLAPEPLGNVIAGMTRAQQVISGLGPVAPFMSAKQIADVIEALGQSQLTGSDLGHVIRAMNKGWGLSDSALAQLIDEMSLPPADTADLISNLPLTNAEQNNLASSLPWSPEAAQELAEALTTNQALADLAAEVDFQNFQTSAELVAFIEQLGLAPNELAELVSNLGLTPEELAQTATELDVREELAARQSPPVRETVNNETTGSPAVGNQTDLETGPTTDSSAEGFAPLPAPATPAPAPSPIPQPPPPPADDDDDDDDNDNNDNNSDDNNDDNGNNDDDSPAPQPQPPIFASQPITVLTEDVSYRYAITATDPDIGEVLTLTALTRPAWLQFTNEGNGRGLLSGLPTNSDVGSHPIALHVVNSLGLSATQQFSLNVANVNDAPLITSTPLTTVIHEDSPYSYTVRWVDVDAGDIITLTTPVRPNWLSLTPPANGRSGRPEFARGAGSRPSRDDHHSSLDPDRP